MPLNQGAIAQGAENPEVKESKQQAQAELFERANLKWLK
jgi:hypothetical protein